MSDTADAADLLLRLTAIPTAAGRESRVIDFIRAWVAQRPALDIASDDAGNLVIAPCSPRSDDERPPLLITAHLDHPAFVIDRAVSDSAVEADFRGGVLAPYFEDARVRIHMDDRAVPARIVSSKKRDPFRRAVLELESNFASDVPTGALATWDLPAPSIEGDLLKAPACDDLAAVAAALAALERIIAGEWPPPDVRILLTRAEEVGFVGAVAACRLGTIPSGAQVIALENSRAYPEVPLGGGPIVRVGDRMSVFSPALTRAVHGVACRLAGETERQVGDATPEKRAAATFNFQRRLMPGGACEATAFCAWGHDATCLCLPLRNYHNMGELDRVEAELRQTDDPLSVRAPIAPEIIHMQDYHNLVALLVACARDLREAAPPRRKLEDLYESRRFVLDEPGRG